MVIRIGAFRSYEERLDEIRAQAAWWVAREHTGRMREAERMDLRDWLARSPAHELEYMLADSLYADDDLVAAMRLVPRYVPEPRGARWKEALAQGGRWLHEALIRGAAPKLVAAAAAILLVIGLASLIDPFGRTPSTGEDARLADGMTLKTQNGERLLVQLPDGTRVEMAGGSEAKVRFARDARHFALTKGEALFEVAHDTARPFLIATDRAGVRVVGTRFLIREMPADTRVDVFDGIVEIRAPAADASTMRVRRGTRVTVGRDVTIGRFDPGTEQDWRGGWVDEASVSLGALAQLIEQRTGTQITVDPELAQVQVSGRFRITQPEQLLAKLGPVYGFHASRTAEGYRIAK